jgi:hypothetical protein
MHPFFSMAALEAAIQLGATKLDGRVKPAHGEVLV